MEEFDKNLDDLVEKLQSRKRNVKAFLTKHFKKTDYKIEVRLKTSGKQRGGQNKEKIFLKTAVYDLILASYNLKNRYVTKMNNFEIVNPLLMNLENSTVGFISEVLKNLVKSERQFSIGKYYIDLYLPNNKIAIECDEYDHARGYDKNSDAQRTSFINSQLNCKWIRFDPTSKDFDLATLLNQVLLEIYSK